MAFSDSPWLRIARQPALRGPGGDLGARAEAELGQDVLDVVFGGAWGDDQGGGDVFVARSPGHEVGDLLFAAVNLARKLRVDPELALRAAADRFRGRVEGAEGLAASEGRTWNDLGADDQLAYYARARRTEEPH